MQICAVILAGGAGSRMAATGAQIPKVYLPVGLEPVINRPVTACLELDEIRQILILTRKSHPSLPQIDLENWAESWKRLWFNEEPRVQTVYEEELPLLSQQTASQGAIIALARLLRGIREGKHQKLTGITPTHLLVIAGDTFLDVGLKRLLAGSQEHQSATILATRRLDTASQASGRFGVAELLGEFEHSKICRHVIRYEEKPEVPRAPTVSIGLYMFPIEHAARFEEYLASQSDKSKAGAPGHFIEWLVGHGQDAGAQATVCAVPFEDGIWADVGTPESFLQVVLEAARKLIQRPHCARELDVLGSTKNLQDRYYFVCSRLDVSIGPDGNDVGLYFEGGDSLAVLDGSLADGKQVISIKHLRERQHLNDDLWKILESAEGSYGSPRSPKTLPAPILMSGGVFLVDRGGAAGYQMGDAIVPLFMRDAGAPVDAGRLTTAAGRMDRLDLMALCVAEHSEEMIFFGGEATSEQARILVSAPPEWQRLARETVVGRVVDKGFSIPGIDHRQLRRDEAARSRAIYIVQTGTHTPPHSLRWRVRIYYRDSPTTEWQVRHTYDDFVLVPDRGAATFEFRVIWLTALTGDSGTPNINRTDGSFGRIRGVFDGDGYSRTAFLVRANDLVQYVREIEKRPSLDILLHSDRQDGPGLQWIATTEASSGRLSSFSGRLPIAPLTTAVYRFVRLLERL